MLVNYKNNDAHRRQRSFSSSSVKEGKYIKSPGKDESTSIKPSRAPVVFESSCTTQASHSWDEIRDRYHAVSQEAFPGCSEFLPSILEAFLQPTWYGVSVPKSSRISVLPSVGAVATVIVPRRWLPGDSENSFLVCRDFNGKWTLVNTEWIKDVKASSDSSPCNLTKFISKVNSSVSRHTSFIVFDGIHGYVVEHDFINDKLFVYKYDQESERLVCVTTVSDLPPGAVNIHSIRGSTMMISTGSCFHEYDMFDPSGGRWRTLSTHNQPPQSKHTLPLPVSTQQIVPSNSGYVFLLSGSVYRSFPQEKLTLLKTPPRVHYVSICNGAGSSIVLLGYERENGDKVVTLLDQEGTYVISTSIIEFNLPLSIVSIHIDPVSLDTIIIGRSGSINGGSIVQSIPPLYH